MPVTLIICLGARDAQVKTACVSTVSNENQTIHYFEREDILIDAYAYEGAHKFVNPRYAGEQLLQLDWPSICPQLSFPIATPFFQYIADRNYSKIDQVFLIATDQIKDNTVGEKQKNLDSIFLAHLFKKWLEEQNTLIEIGQVEILAMTKDLTYADIVYEDLNFLFEKGVLQNIEVNQPLLLQMANRFEQFHLLIKPRNKPVGWIRYEDHIRISKENFLLQKAFKNFNYDLILQQDGTNKELVSLADTLLDCLKYDINKAIQKIDLLSRHASSAQHRSAFHSLEQYLLQLKKDPFTRQQLMYVTAKIKFRQEAYADFLFRQFTLVENIYKLYAEEVLGAAIHFDAATNHRSYNALIDAIPALSLRGRSGVRKPNRFAMKSIYEYGVAQGLIPIVPHLAVFNQYLQHLGDLRNRIAHQVEGVNRTEIELALTNVPNGSLEAFFQTGDALFSVEGYGIFDTINRDIIGS